MTLSHFPKEPTYEPVRIGVVGLGYWGPNLIRNLNELEAAICAGSAISTRSRLDAIVEAISRGQRHAVGSTSCSKTRSSRPSRIATPVSTHYPLGSGRLARRKARVHREAAGGVHAKRPRSCCDSPTSED